MSGDRCLELRNWRRLLSLMDPHQSLVSCRTILMDLVVSLFLESLDVNSLSSGVLSTLKSLAVRRLKRAAWSGARCKPVHSVESSFVIYQRKALDDLVRFRTMDAVSFWRLTAAAAAAAAYNALCWGCDPLPYLACQQSGLGPFFRRSMC